MRKSSFLVNSRRDQIIQELEKNDAVYIDKMSQLLNVSNVTIRRDLELLEKSGRVVRFHGGAKLNKENNQLSTLEEKLQLNVKEKRLITQKAAEFVQDDDIVFVNNGSTVAFIPQYITSNNVTIISNNARLPSCEFGQNITLHVTGGALDRKMMSLTGQFAIHALKQVYANKCLIGVNGITAECGITTSILEEAAVNSLMISRCNGKRIVVADSSKVGRLLSFISSPIDNIDVLITTTLADKEAIKKLRDCGVEVIDLPIE